jgi:benzoyl-CoA reductase subunit A
VGTGYGRVNVPFAQRTITEIACHARGANHMAGPSVRTILDMGGQDCKVIRCDGRGKVLNFIMNDKCAAGTGRGMEVIADVLSVPVEEIGRRSFEIDDEPPPVSNVCTVFAKSEATTLLRAGWSVERVLAAYCAAMAQRVAGLIERMQVERDFFITGGIGKNVGVTRRIERLIGVDALKLPADSVLDPQIAGALGAALFAHSLHRKGSRDS